MLEAFDIAIRQGRLRGRGDWLGEIGIKDGRIIKIAERLEGKAAMEIDARGNLVTRIVRQSALASLQSVDAADDGRRSVEELSREAMGKAMAGIELASKIKEKYANSWITDNARRAVGLAASR